MKKFVLASVAALAFASPSVAAEFTGPRVGATVGFIDDDFIGTDTFSYGVNVGADAQVGNLVGGITLEYQDSDEDLIGRDLAASLRFGPKVGERALVYGILGYTNLSVELPGNDEELHGVRAGAGVEFAVTDKVFATTEYRYSNYEQDLDGHQWQVGLGFRF